MPERAPLRAALGVGLVAGCTLALQVLLTRVLSAVLSYHFGFLAISLALLGVGAGALAVYVRPELVRGAARALLARWSARAGGRCWWWCRSCSCGSTTRSGSARRHRATSSLTLALVCVLAALPFLRGGHRDRPRRARLRPLDRPRLRVRPGGRRHRRARASCRCCGSSPAHAAGGACRGRGRARGAAVRRRARKRDRRRRRSPSSPPCSPPPRSLYALPPHTTAADGRAAGDERWTPLSRVLGYPPPGGASSRRCSTTASTRRAVRKPGRAAPGLAHARRSGPQSVGYALTGPGARS